MKQNDSTQYVQLHFNFIWIPDSNWHTFPLFLFLSVCASTVLVQTLSCLLDGQNTTQVSGGRVAI